MTYDALGFCDSCGLNGRTGECECQPAPVVEPSQGADEAWERAVVADPGLRHQLAQVVFMLGYVAAKAEQAAPSEPLSPTTEELVETVSDLIRRNYHDVMVDEAEAALTELARRCAK